MYQWYVIHPNSVLTPIKGQHHNYFQLFRQLKEQEVEIKFLLTQSTLERWEKLLQECPTDQHFKIDFAGEIHPNHRTILLYELVTRNQISQWLTLSHQVSHDQRPFI